MWNEPIFTRDLFETCQNFFEARHETQPENFVLGRDDFHTAVACECALASFGTVERKHHDHWHAAARLVTFSQPHPAGGNSKLGGHRHGCALLGRDPRVSSLFVECADAEALSIPLERVDLRIVVVVILSDHGGGGIEPNDTTVDK